MKLSLAVLFLAGTIFTQGALADNVSTNCSHKTEVGLFAPTKVKTAQPRIRKGRHTASVETAPVSSKIKKVTQLSVSSESAAEASSSISSKTSS